MSIKNLTENPLMHDDRESTLAHDLQIKRTTPEVVEGTLNVRVLTSTMDVTRRTLERLSFERINGQKANIDR